MKPRFGRAAADLGALVTRARTGDYKGVLQNARLVLETLLRSIVVSDLKQTPGRSTLDELLSKFRQSAHAGVIPTNVLVHMGTIQAWGNLGAHDHAGSLHDAPVTIGPEEALVGLNSILAILAWYDGKYAGPSSAEKPVEARAQRHKRPAAIVASVVVLALVAAVVAGTMLNRQRSRASLRAALDASFRRAKDPPPPLVCQETRAALLEALNAAATSLASEPTAEVAAHAASRLEAAAPAASRSAEHWYLLARAHLWGGAAPDAALEEARHATSCGGFAAAHNLAGKALLAAQRVDDADAEFRVAARIDPGFAKPRFNQGIIRLKIGGTGEAIARFREAIERDGELAEARYFLGLALNASDRPEEARSELCEAKRLGYAPAAEKCP